MRKDKKKEVKREFLFCLVLFDENLIEAKVQWVFGCFIEKEFFHKFRKEII